MPETQEKSRLPIRLLKWIGYPLFGLASFAFFLLLTFPFGKVLGILDSQLREKANISISAENISGSFPLGFHAEAIRLDSLDSPPSPFFPMQISDLTLNIGLFSALMGKINVAFDSEIFGGELKADITVDEGEKIYQIAMEAADIRFEEMPAIKNNLEDLPISGSFAMESDLELHLEKPELSKGFLEMHIADGIVGPGKFGVEIPKLNTGSFESRFVFDKGQLIVERYEQQSPDMSSGMIGHIALMKKPANSRANLDYRFKLSDDLLKKHDIFKLALSAVQSGQGTDGYYYYSLTGPFSHLKTKPNKSAQFKFRKLDQAKKKSGSEKNLNSENGKRTPKKATRPNKRTRKHTARKPNTKTKSKASKTKNRKHRRPGAKNRKQRPMTADSAAPEKDSKETAAEEVEEDEETEVEEDAVEEEETTPEETPEDAAEETAEEPEEPAEDEAEDAGKEEPTEPTETEEEL